MLCEEPNGITQLLVRERHHYLRGWARFIVEPIAVVSFVMTHTMLRVVTEIDPAYSRFGADSTRRGSLQTGSV